MVRYSLSQSRPQCSRQAVYKRLGDPQARDMHKVVVRRLIIPGRGIFSPVPPVIKPGFPEGKFPGGTLDEPQLGCTAMVRVTQGAQTGCLFPGGGTSFPPYISLEPAEPQHTPDALQGQPGDPMNTRKPKCSAALEYPFLCWGGCDTTANDSCGRFRRLTWR